MTSNASLDVFDLSFAYGKKRALDNVSFSVENGCFTALLGPNGAGKTTLYALITQLFESRQGGIKICGFDLKSQRKEALTRLGVVFQQPTLDLDLSVTQNLHYFASLHGLSASEANKRISRELERLDMLERKDEQVRSLNGGHRRRVEIVRALLHEPQLLLLDEPTVGLDVPTRRDIVNHIHALCQEKGIAALWATHLIDEVQLDDAVIVLHQGAIKAKGLGREIVEQAQTSDLASAYEIFTRRAS
ncbi:MAG: ATP-binding cassette domain-containing protein [Rhodospirillales bacterium]|nr:ATP-binding cassette domain-containing protein [Rhodospirillales bacterium]